MKKFLMMVMCAMLLTGCGTSEPEEVVENVEEEIEVEVSNEKDEEETKDVKEDSNSNTNENQKEDDKNLEEITEEEKHANELIGLTFQEFYDKGIEFSGYMGMNGDYTFSAESEDGLIRYECASTEASSVMENISIEDNWEEKVSSCVIDKIDVTIFDPELPLSMVGKKLSEVIGEGYVQSGYMGYDTLILSNGKTKVLVYLDESCEEIYNSTENIDNDKYYELFGNCTIEEAKYW